MAKLTVIALMLAACILLATESHAQNTTPCPCICRRNRDPVCTENNEGVKKVYDNACRLECANRCDHANAVEVEKSKCGLD